MPALAIPTEGLQPEPSTTDKTGADATTALYGAMRKELDISDDRVDIPRVRVEELPRCPKCKTGLLRPGVVWFGEALPRGTMQSLHEFLNEPNKVDLILVIGTSAKVYPAAGYVNVARMKGARVAVVNMDRADTPGGDGGLLKDDWFFEGDAGVIVPEILRSVIGDV